MDEVLRAVLGSGCGPHFHDLSDDPHPRLLCSGDGRRDRHDRHEAARALHGVGGRDVDRLRPAFGRPRDQHRPGRPPALYGAQEVCSFLGWSLVLYFLIVQLRFPTHALASLVFPTATILTLISAIAPPIGERPASLADDPLLFSFHAGLMLLAYGAFFTMFMAALLYITQEREIKGKHFGAIFHRLPSLETCDSIGFRSLAIGFVMLTAGIALGMFRQYRRSGTLSSNGSRSSSSRSARGWCTSFSCITG